MTTAFKTALDFQVMMTGETNPSVHSGESLDAQDACALLEQGGILFFPQSPFHIAPADLAFLLDQKQMGAGRHKNIAYKPALNKVTGVDVADPQDVATLHRIMADYYRQTSQFIDTFLTPYAGGWEADYGSFRPIEEQGRKLRLRGRNDLLHVDSFPTRATHGKRILRVFTNISPDITRVWNTSENFEQLLGRFKSQTKPFRSGFFPEQSGFRQAMSGLPGLKGLTRPAYDRWMMSFHNFLKENSRFQEKCLKNYWEFPPGASWLVYTDFVSHAVLSGQYALEQTYLIDHTRQVMPEKAPIRLLQAV